MKNMLLVFTLFFSSYSLADCNFNTSVNNIHVNWTGQSQEIQQKITTSRGPDKNFSCRFYFYTFSKGNSGTYNRKLTNHYGESINYNLYQGTGEKNVLKDFNDLQSTDRFLRGLLFFPNVAKENTFYFSLRQPSQGSSPLVRSGTYRDSVKVNVYSSLFVLSPRLETSRIINVSTIVPKQVNISLVDTGSPFNVNDTEQTLDFGELEKGENLSFDMRIQSNAGYIVSFSSYNRGRLKHLTKNKSIRYKLKVDGKRKNLRKSGSTKVAEARGVSPVGGNLHKVSVTIGKVKKKPSGVYTDYITVTAMTKD